MLRTSLIRVLAILNILLIPLLSASNDLSITDNGNRYSFEVSHEDASAISLTLDVKDNALKQITYNGYQYAKADFGLEPTTGRAGWPDLPIISHLVLVPPTSDIDLQIDNIQSRIEDCDHPFISPAQDGSADLSIPGVACPEYLEYEGFWPPNPIVISEPAILRGHRLVQITLFPMQYNPQTGMMKFNDRFDFHLEYSGTGKNIVINPDRPRPSSSIQKLLESLVINPPPRRDQSEHPQRGSYLLIYPTVNGVEEAIEPLIEWRARQGWEVHTADVRNSPGTNAVRNIIRDAYNEWDNPPEMVALVGDAEGAININAYSATTDFDYVLIEGNDILADADLGRISVENVNRLEQVVEKLVSYEADPYMDDTDWFIQGMVCAGNSISGLSTILVNRWVRNEILERGFDNVHEWYYNAPYQGQSVPTFFTNEFRRGVSVANYRGWIGIEGTSPGMIMGFRAHEQYPIATILTCGSGNYINTTGVSEAMLRSPGGGIGSVGFCTSSTHVQYNNAVDTGIWVGFLKEDLWHFGTAINRGRYGIYRQYQGFENNNVDNYSRWMNLMGDPATHVWTGIPLIIDAEHPESIPLGSSHFTIRAVGDDDDQNNHDPLNDAFVCLYKADDEFQATAYTNIDGEASFIIPSDALSEGELMITVTKHNVKPYLAEIDVEEQELYLGVIDWDIEDDEDGDPNPGETIDMNLMIANLGTDVPEGEITITAESLSDWAEITSEPFSTDDIPEVDETVDVPITVQLNPSVPDGEEILLSISTQNDETSWLSMASLDVRSPKTAIAELDFEDGELEPGSIQNLDIEIANIGHKALEPFTARLWSETNVARVIENEIEYDAIEPDDTGRAADGSFRVRAHPLTIPGMEVVFVLAIETENGFRDTTRISYQIGNTGQGDPFGPDNYGYVCFDSDDESWEIRPEYEWIEIDPDENIHDFNGEDLELRDSGEDQDESEAVDLPFEFQYYGELFDEITICTNGWAAFDTDPFLCDFRNRRIASGGGPNAQLCVFWDNLRTGRILTYNDREGGRFIVEWNDMTCLWGGQRETFELILYSQQAQPTYTGDGVIVFQYKEIENASGSGNNDTPYATVGIGNLDDTDGLEYTYWNRYHDGAKHLEDEMAIKFTTATHFITGVLEGQVTDVATGDPIPGSEIIASRGPRLGGFWTETDTSGYYINDEVLIGENYIITASAQGYNDSTLSGLEILEGETLTVDFALLHPEFVISGEELNFTMLADSVTEAGLTLLNSGNGTLAFTSRYVYVFDDEGEGFNPPDPEEDPGTGPVRGIGRDDPDEIWDELLTWPAGDTLRDTRLNGIVYIHQNSTWLISGDASGDDENWFYIFDRWGNYIDRIIQPIAGRYGIRDMDYYNGFLYCTTSGSYIMLVDPETGEEINRWSTPPRLTSIRNVAVVNDTLIFASSICNDLFLVSIANDSTLVEVNRYQPRDPRDENLRVRMYGLAYFRDDPDGYNLYIMSNNEPIEDNEVPNISIFKMNPNDGDVRLLTTLDYMDTNTSGRGGISITPKWNNLVWVIATVLDHPEGDFVDIFELAPNSSWIDYTPRSDTLFATESIPLALEIASADLDTGLYGVVIQFSHNAGNGITRLPVSLHVVDELPPPPYADEDETVPFEYSLDQNHPNPFNPTTLIGYSLRVPGFTELKIYDVLGREVETYVTEHQPPGRYLVTFDAGELPAGIYFYRLKSGSFIAVRKMVVMR